MSVSVPTMSVAKLSGSVGRGGVNREADVLAVQKLLNAAAAMVAEDGDCGRATIGAIEDFQRNWTARPDGLVSPGGRTWQRLNERRLKVKRGVAKVLLPQMSGNGYYSYSPLDRQYGTPATVKTLVTVCKAFAQQFPGVLIAVGDMSFVNGAEMPPHDSHRNGLNADMRPLRKDGKMLPVTIFDAQYSRERTAALVALLREQKNVRSILFNDKQITGVTTWAGHDNHLHVNMHE